jgi:hypothetical protein
VLSRFFAEKSHTKHRFVENIKQIAEKLRK